MHLHELLDDRESKTESAMLTRARSALLAQAFEHAGQEIATDPFARVADLHLNL